MSNPNPETQTPEEPAPRSIEWVNESKIKLVSGSKTLSQLLKMINCTPAKCPPIIEVISTLASIEEDVKMLKPKDNDSGYVEYLLSLFYEDEKDENMDMKSAEPDDAIEQSGIRKIYRVIGRIQRKLMGDEDGVAWVKVYNEPIISGEKERVDLIGVEMSVMGMSYRDTDMYLLLYVRAVEDEDGWWRVKEIVPLAGGISYFDAGADRGDGAGFVALKEEITALVEEWSKTTSRRGRVVEGQRERATSRRNQLLY